MGGVELLPTPITVPLNLITMRFLIARHASSTDSGIRLPPKINRYPPRVTIY
jgi:hypothetical protein